MFGLNQMHRLLTAFSTAARMTFMLGWVPSAPNENLIICREAADSGFMALMTCDGSSESARQAEPDEAQIPSLSSKMSSASDSMP